MRYTTIPCSAALVIAALAASTAVAQTYTIRDLGTLSGATSEAFGLNNFGRVVGAATLSDASMRGFFRDASGVLAPIPPLAGDSQSHAYSLNDAGQAVAMSFDMGGLVTRGVRWENGVATSLGDIAPTSINASGQVVGYLSSNLAGFGWLDHAALWQNGQIVDLGTLGGHWSYATSIADSGRIVGMSFLTNDINRRATLWQGGAPRDLGTLGGLNSYAYDINAGGVVVGIAEIATGRPHAFRYTLDAAGSVVTRTDLGALGGDTSCAYAINDDGVIVGSSYGEAFVYSAGAMQALTPLVPPEKHWRLDLARAINNRGQIAGVGLHFGQPRAFLATPVKPGDLNCDGVVDFFDIDPLVAAFAGATSYDASFPDCRWLNGDCDADGDVDFFDIDPFVALLGT